MRIKAKGRIGVIFLAILLIGVLLTMSCSSDNSTTTPNQTTTAPTTTQASTKTIELKFAAQHAPTTDVAKVDQAWADRIYEKSGGKLKITCYFSESLAKYAELYRAVQTGVADCAYYAIGTNPGVTELNKVLSLPFMGLTDMYMPTPIMEQLWEEFPEMKDEFKGMVVLGPRAMAGNHWHTTGKEILVPADIKGMKTIASATTADQMKIAGANPVTLGIGDWYMSLERGLVDSHFTHYAVIYAFKTIDLMPYHLNFGDFGAQCSLDVYIFNQNVWDSLGPELQAVVEEATNWRVKEVADRDVAEVQRSMDYGKSLGQKFVQATDEQIELWKEAFLPYHEQWIKDTGGKAREIYNRAVELIEEATK